VIGFLPNREQENKVLINLFVMALKCHVQTIELISVEQKERKKKRESGKK